MTTRYRCPISTCRWFHDAVAAPPPAYCPPDLLSWSGPTWASMSERIDGGLAAAHVIDAHLVTHSPVEWMTELRLYQARAEAAEDRADRLEVALELTADVTAAVHPVTSMRLPSRAEVEESAAVLAGVTGGGGVDA